ncbi:MAG: peptidoglycan editing factor PgeF [Gammaproteobacteria bacterium]
MKNYLRPDWPVPGHVHAFTTIRIGGLSHTPFSSFNLADHVGDSPDCVIKNRQLLDKQLQLPSQPRWLQQVHGTAVVEADTSVTPVSADASFTGKSGVVCAVLTADCLPVLFCDQAGSCVAAAHAGWRGLASGVLEATITAMPVVPAKLSAWMGPAIGPNMFEVGDEVRQEFVAHDKQAQSCFTATVKGKWLADIYALARLRLMAAGVTEIYGGGFCTFEDVQRFYSYRRDGMTGRMASLIWLSD